MTQVKLEVEVPEELLSLLSGSGLSARDRAGQIRAALAIHLFLVGEISLGKAAELSGEGRAQFEDLLLRLGLPLVQYDEEDYRQDMDDALQRLRREGQAEF